MHTVLKTLARLGLVLTVLPSLLYLADAIDLSAAKWIMIAGTILWMGAAPIVQKQKQTQES